MSFDALRKDIRHEMNELADHVAGGGCIDWAEYRWLCGKIEGLALAERMLLDLQDKLKIADE